MEPRFPLNFAAHRVAALETQTLMRETITDVQRLIKQTRGVIEDTRVAIGRADAMLRVIPRRR
jgi:hypothetical protein